MGRRRTAGNPTAVAKGRVSVAIDCLLVPSHRSVSRLGRCVVGRRCRGWHTLGVRGNTLLHLVGVPPAGMRRRSPTTSCAVRMSQPEPQEHARRWGAA
eukprot:583931-Pleurochrysis_carterae.AAC.1